VVDPVARETWDAGELVLVIDDEAAMGEVARRKPCTADAPLRAFAKVLGRGPGLERALTRRVERKA
jgi:hypothetical protein